MTDKKKIFVLVPPLTGHVNPISDLISGLCQQKNIEVFFFSDDEYRGLIEKTGAKFRRYSHPTYLWLKNWTSDDETTMGGMLNEFISISYLLMPQLTEEVERERPDMIIYDPMFLTGKYLIEIIKARYESGQSKYRPPKTVSFVPNFPPCPQMIESFKKHSKDNLMSVFPILNSFGRQFYFSWTYGISVYNPINFFMAPNPNLNIVAVAPELHPYREDFDDTFKFVGSCVCEDTRKFDFKNDPELGRLLEQFERKAAEKKEKLVYMSMGTLFVNGFHIYERLVEAVKRFDENPNHSIQMSQLRVVMSAGEKGLKMFNEKISNGEIQIPDNILIRAKVPQLEVLKRADLFVTHCGMNSTTETIKYGVPVVAIPIQADQPINAERICDDLSIGIRLDATSLNPSLISDAIDQVLSEPKYKKNVVDLSNSIQKHNGVEEGSMFILKYLKQD